MKGAAVIPEGIVNKTSGNQVKTARIKLSQTAGNQVKLRQRGIKLSQCRQSHMHTNTYTHHALLSPYCHCLAGPCPSLCQDCALSQQLPAVSHALMHQADLIFNDQPESSEIGFLWRELQEVVLTCVGMTTSTTSRNLPCRVLCPVFSRIHMLQVTSLFLAYQLMPLGVLYCHC